MRHYPAPFKVAYVVASHHITLKSLYKEYTMNRTIKNVLLAMAALFAFIALIAPSSIAPDAHWNSLAPELQPEKIRNQAKIRTDDYLDGLEPTPSLSPDLSIDGLTAKIRADDFLDKIRNPQPELSIDGLTAKIRTDDYLDGLEPTPSLSIDNVVAKIRTDDFLDKIRNPDVSIDGVTTALLQPEPQPEVSWIA